MASMMEVDHDDELGNGAAMDIDSTSPATIATTSSSATAAAASASRRHSKAAAAGTTPAVANGSRAYQWEAGYADGLANINQVLEESETGTIDDAIRRLVDEARRARRTKQKPAKARLGNMRYLQLCVDFSLAMLSQELLSAPRISVVLSNVRRFVHRYFEQNPLSQLGIIMCRDKRAQRLCNFSSSPHAIRETIASINPSASCSGEFSLCAALQLAFSSLQPLPSHASREVLFVMGSLATIDGESVAPLFTALREAGVKCSVVGLAAEMFICKRMTSTTGGKYSVALDESHFELLLDDHVDPPLVSREQEATVSLVRMGFPTRCQVTAPSICLSHCPLFSERQQPNHSKSNGPQEGSSKQLDSCHATRAFFCPRCGARHCEVPVECRLCGLLLITAPQLARAHQHLEPLAAFDEVDLAPGPPPPRRRQEEREEEKNGGGGDGGGEAHEGRSGRKPLEERCYACSQLLRAQGEKKVYVCRRCGHAVCIDCDLLLHESLQVCPGCG